MHNRLALSVFLGLAITSVHVGQGYANEPDRQKCSERYSVAWTMPLQQSDVGKPVRDVLSRPEFKTVSNVHGDLSRLSIGRAPDKTISMQMNIKKGANTPTNYALGQFGNKGVKAACLSLRVYFQSGFEWSKTGSAKLGFGLWGGSHTKSTGGTRPIDQKGWTVRNVHSHYGVRLYSYHLNRPSRFGENPGGLARWGSMDWRPGQWHDIEMEVVMNDPGRSNGYAQMWLNDSLHQNMTNLRFSKNNEWLIRGLMATDMWGGSYNNPDFFSPKNQKIWYADYKLYTKPSGITPTSSTTPPSTAQSTGTDQTTTPENKTNPKSSIGARSPSGVIDGKTPTLTWTADPKADKYYVQVLTDRTKWADRRIVFQGSAYPSNCNGSTCKLTIGNLSRDKYEWQVRSEYGSKKGDYSTLPFAVR